MKRSIIIFISCILAASVLQGCRRYVDNVDSGGDATLQIGIVTKSASTKVVDNRAADNRAVDSKAVASRGILGESEYAIQSLRIFAFDTDGKLDKVDFVSYSNPVVGSVYHTFEVKKAPQKILYVVVNEPAGLFANVENITTQEQLKGLEFRIADNMNAGFNAAASFEADDFLIPMTAEATINASENTSVKIGVDRAVARVDLMLDKNSDAETTDVEITDATVFTINGVVLGSKLLAGGELSEVSASEVEESFDVVSSKLAFPLEVSDNSTSARALTFYVAERLYDTTNEDTRISIGINSLKVGGVAVNLNNTIVLGNEVSHPLSQIQRNYLYQIFATYNGKEEELVADEFLIKDWVYTEFDGDIEGVIMAVENMVVADWLRNGNSFTSPISSFGSNKPVRVFLPVSLGDNDGDGLVDYEFTEYDFDISAGNSYDLVNLPLENSLIEEMKWIEKAVLKFTSDRTGYLEVTYTPHRTTYDLQSYPIRFKSDNVVKQMKVVYDNGYIPYEYLPPHLQLRAPGGVIFAKRGYALNPRDVEDVLVRDADGFYRGDHSLTAVEAEAYCKELGEMWYVPKKEDLDAMLRGVKELGTSYRLQDTGSSLGEPLSDALFWTDTESATTAGNYWCGNFKYIPGTVTDTAPLIVERNGSELNFVRCMLDLK